MKQTDNILEVVIAVIINAKSQVLIAKRKQDQFMSDYWEFPGGKIEKGETRAKSLARELKEELNITIADAVLIHTMTHQYTQHKVRLWVYKINSFAGNIAGFEGQQILWTSFKDLNKLNLLPTMRAIVNRMIMPTKYWITPELSQLNLLSELKNRIKKISMVQLRTKDCADKKFFNDFYQICKKHNITFILNNKDKNFEENCDGWHLSSKELFCFDKRPCAKDKILGVSAHCIEDIEYAYAIDADYISISPVAKTQSHPNTKAIGWHIAKKFVEKSNLPVYLLGGMADKDINRAIDIGAQGIAGISKL